MLVCRKLEILVASFAVVEVQVGGGCLTDAIVTVVISEERRNQQGR